VVSPAYGLGNEAPAIRISATVDLPAECSLLIVVQPETNELGEFLQIMDSERDEVHAYRYNLLDTTHFFFFSKGAGAWTQGQWVSDAEFLYCSIEHGRPAQLIMIAGSYARYGDTTMTENSRRLDRFEWSIRPGELQRGSSISSVGARSCDGDLEGFDRSPSTVETER